MTDDLGTDDPGSDDPGRPGPDESTDSTAAPESTGATESIAEHLERIATGPTGPKCVAFFDYDGTVIDGYSAGAVFRERLRRRDIGPIEMWELASAAVEMRVRNSTVDNLMDRAVRALAGKGHDELLTDARRLFRDQLAGMIYPDIRAVIAAHKRVGHRVVMATSATPYQAMAVVEDLGFDDIICTVPEVDAEGRLTGQVPGGSLWGPRKAQGVLDWALANDADLDISWAYSNGGEDVPMLEIVGNPVAINPDSRLTKQTTARGWPVLKMSAAPSSIDLTSAVRTVAALGAIATTTGLGIGVGLLRRNRRSGANLVSSAGTPMALALAGIDLDITGEEYLWQQRPAVFVFNHQSNLDAIVVVSLLRRDITALAKKELARAPYFAPLGSIFSVAYIDRKNPNKAGDPLAPAVEKLRDGISVVIAPEGTRMPTPSLGRFKSGAFRLAAVAGVPIVPIVLGGVGQLMSRSALVARPGTVRVSVGRPYPTTDWDPNDLAPHIAEVRAFFQEELDRFTLP